MGLVGIWRRKWDSNPRPGYPGTRLPTGRFRPLSHLSTQHEPPGEPPETRVASLHSQGCDGQSERESNPQPAVLETAALPIELSPHIKHHHEQLEPETGFEPARDFSGCLQGSCRRPLGYSGQTLKTTKIVGVAGLEPATHASQTHCATELRYTPKNAETVRFELTGGFPPQVFKARALDHSATSPEMNAQPCAHFTRRLVNEWNPDKINCGAGRENRTPRSPAWKAVGRPLSLCLPASLRRPRAHDYIDARKA